MVEGTRKRVEGDCIAGSIEGEGVIETVADAKAEVDAQGDEDAVALIDGSSDPYIERGGDAVGS